MNERIICLGGVLIRMTMRFTGLQATQVCFRIFQFNKNVWWMRPSYSNGRCSELQLQHLLMLFKELFWKKICVFANWCEFLWKKVTKQSESTWPVNKFFMGKICPYASCTLGLWTDDQQFFLTRLGLQFKGLIIIIQ